MGADVNALSAERISAIEVAVETGNEQALYALHNAGANAGLAPALLRAAASSATHSTPMIVQLIKMGAPPNSAAPDGATGLHMAALTGNAAATEALLHGGAHANALTKQGATALFLSAMNGQVNVMRLLLENGADASLRNENKWSPLFVAAHEGHVSVCALR